MTDHETAAGVGEARLVAHPQPGKVWVQIPHRNDIGSDWIAVDELPAPAASTDPAPEGGLREAVEALVKKWRSEDDLSQWGNHDKTWCARDVEAALAAHPAPETPEQVPTSDAGGVQAGGAEGLSAIVAVLVDGRCVCGHHFGEHHVDTGCHSAVDDSYRCPCPLDMPNAEATAIAPLLSAAATRARAEGAAAVRDDIQARRREFRRLNADSQYLLALDDAYGLANNRARSES